MNAPNTGEMPIRFVTSAAADTAISTSAKPVSDSSARGVVSARPIHLFKIGLATSRAET